jgi:hypothetical protein
MARRTRTPAAAKEKQAKIMETPCTTVQFESALDDQERTYTVRVDMDEPVPTVQINMPCGDEIGLEKNEAIALAEVVLKAAQGM